MFYSDGLLDDFDDGTDAENDEPRSPVYSDRLSSDCEAEMYQKIHHAEKVESQIVRSWKNDSSPKSGCRYFERLWADEKMSVSSAAAGEGTLFPDRGGTDCFGPFGINSATASKDTLHSTTSFSSASAATENSDPLSSFYRDESTTNPWKFSFLLESSAHAHNGRTRHTEKRTGKGYSTSTPINKHLSQGHESSVVPGCSVSLDNSVESTDDDGVVLIDSTGNTVNSIKCDVTPSFREPSPGKSELYESNHYRNLKRRKTLERSRSSTGTVDYTDDSSDSDVIILDSASSPDNLLTNVNIKGNHGRPCSLLGVTDHQNNSDYVSLVGECHSKDTSTTDGFSAIAVGSENSSSSSGHSDDDSWHIDPEDKVAPLSKRARKRYYQEMADSCRKCGETGHSWRRCTQSSTQKCYLCGGGSHKSTNCRKKVCGVCYSVGHDRYQCAYPKRQMRCNLCRVTGHITCRCPDIWRRYHLTTTSELITKGPPRSINDSGPKFCYNCGNSGHFGYECIKPRLCKGSSASLPYVVSYKNPAKMICSNPPPAVYPDFNASRLGMNQSRYFSKTFPARGKFNHFKKKNKKLKQDSRFTSEVKFNRTPKANTSSDCEIIDIWKRKRKKKRKKKANTITNFVSEPL